MRLREITERLERLFPRDAACDWDNPGLLVGHLDAEVHSIYVALDATEEVIEEAVSRGCELIVTHHPVIFRGVRELSDASPLGRKLLRLAESRTAVFSMHTNYDASPSGMGQLVSRMLGLRMLAPLEEIPFREQRRETEESAEGGERYGIGFLAELPDILSPESFSLLVKRVFRLPAVELYDAGRPVKRIACCPGSGRGQLANVLRSGAGLFLSGDLGHHDGLDFVEAGISLVNAGHYGLEHPFSEELAGLLSAEYPELSVTAAPIRFPARFL